MTAWCRMLIFALAAATAITASGQEWRAEAQRLLGESRWAEAIDEFDTILRSRPTDVESRYGRVVALAQVGDADAAIAGLAEAIRLGFTDFHRLERDRRLAPLRANGEFLAIIDGWRDLLDTRADVNEESLRRLFGAGHVVERDPRLRLLYSSAWRDETFGLARREIETVAQWAADALFDEYTVTDSAENPKPDPWVSVIIPTPERFAAMMIALGAGPNVGGLYDQDRGQLICRDIGPSLRHEFLHVLHWRLLTRLGQSHPDWIMEGLGALVEDFDLAADEPGGVRPAPSWRTNVAKRLLEIGQLTPIEDLARMDRATFRGRRPNAQYAQARALMLYVFERGALGEFFRAYVAGWGDDPTGLDALESALGEPIGAIERGFRAWLADLPLVAEEITPGMASLGVVVIAGRGDGPVVDEIPAGSPARAAGLRAGDVLLSVDGRATATMLDLVRVLSQHDPGETVEIIARRGRRALVVPMTLVER